MNNETAEQNKTGEGNAPRWEEVAAVKGSLTFGQTREVLAEVITQRDELLAACRAWEYARKEGGISMVDWFNVAWEKTQAAIARTERSAQ